MAGDAQGTGQVYKLRSVLQGHSMDVKQVSVVSEPSGALLTASRDKTARLYNDGQNGCFLAYKGNTTNLNSNHFVHHCIIKLGIHCQSYTSRTLGYELRS